MLDCLRLAGLKGASPRDRGIRVTADIHVSSQCLLNGAQLASRCYYFLESLTWGCSCVDSMAPQHIASAPAVISAQVCAMDMPARSQPVRAPQQARLLRPPHQNSAAANDATVFAVDAVVPLTMAVGSSSAAVVQYSEAQVLSCKDAKDLLERCLAAVKNGSSQRSALTKQMSEMFAVGFEDARDSVQGQVQDAVGFWDRIEISLKVLQYTGP